MQSKPITSELSPSAAGLKPQKTLLRLTIEGDLKNISHKDTMRMLFRALARASVPIAYSNGFNPHMKVSFLLPRPVGMSSNCDIVVIQCSEHINPDQLKSNLNEQIPDGAEISDVNLPGRR